MNRLFPTFLLTALVALLFMCCSSDDNNSPAEEEEETSETTDYDISSLLSKFEGTGLSYAVNGTTVVFSTQDLPNHTSPYWPSSNSLNEAYNGTNSDFHLNPNRILAQDITLSIPLKPAMAANHQATPLGAMGISRNGVVFFNQYAGPNQPLTNEIDSFDQWLGHPTGQGNYHYHIEPAFLTQQFGDAAFLGLLADGFPVYGPLENGEIITSSDLDNYHGHTSVTEDFPEGIYHYHITSDDPYLNGNGFYGTPGNISN